MRFAEVLVVGSGATGTWAAKCLTENGIDVTLIEAGPALSPEYVSSDLTDEEILQRPIQARCSAFKAPARRFFVNDLENPYQTPTDAPFNWFRGRQVGGRLNTWSRHAVRISNAGFMFEKENDDRSWPVQYEQLAAHYSRVERRLGVYGVADGIACIPDGEFVDRPARSGLTDEVCRNLLARRHMLKITLGRNVQHNPNRMPAPLHDALNTGRLTLIPDTIGVSISVDPGTRRATGIHTLNRVTRELGEISAKMVVLAASAFESVRILLNSKSETYPQGIGGGKGRSVLGHYITDHIFCTTGGPLSSEQHNNAQSSMDSKSDPWDFGDTALYIPGLESTGASFTGRYGVQIALAARGAARWSAAAFGEMIPVYENYVELSHQVRDAWGIPSLRITCRHGSNDVAMAAEVRQHLSALARDAGLQEVASAVQDRSIFSTYGSRLPGAAIHEAGGARMGTHPDNSVLNSYGQCWECQNVFVVDGAGFPYLPFQNPTLTMMAMTDRACAFILKNRAQFFHA